MKTYVGETKRKNQETLLWIDNDGDIFLYIEEDDIYVVLHNESGDLYVGQTGHDPCLYDNPVPFHGKLILEQ